MASGTFVDENTTPWQGAWVTEQKQGLIGKVIDIQQADARAVFESGRTDDVQFVVWFPGVEETHIYFRDEITLNVKVTFAVAEAVTQDGR